MNGSFASHYDTLSATCLITIGNLGVRYHSRGGWGRSQPANYDLPALIRTAKLPNGELATHTRHKYQHSLSGGPQRRLRTAYAPDISR